MFKKGDFHIHSIASDGELKPQEVVKLAESRGVDIISLTDHNTMQGVEEAINAGKKHGITVIPGVELSTRYNGERVHILGYFRDDRYKDATFQEALILIKNKKADAAIDMFKKLRGFNFHLDLSDFRGGTRLTVESGIDFLKLFGAVVVLAHPVVIRKESLTYIINQPFDGIEAKYFRNSDDDTEFFINLARDMGIFYTAGSDFHTNKGVDLKHGLIGDRYLDEGEIEEFLRRLYGHNLSK
jgi:predicted metal-dependent phosphoesterase TrpH